jgi:penicillin-binding protein A
VNKQIRRLGVFLIVCYLALFVKLNQVQVLEADDLNNHPGNSRVVQVEYNRPRGAITSADGALLARSVEVEGENFKRLREYPEGVLFSSVTGYFSFTFGSTGVEKTYNAELTGDTFQQQVRGLADLFTTNENVGNLELSVRKDLQTTARDQLGDREGSIVAVDPRTGAILAFWSTPGFDPNVLSSPNQKATMEAWALMNLDEAKPLQAKMYQERYFPGSTFKVVTGSVGLQSGRVTMTEPNYQVANSYLPPQTTRPISNFGGSSCGGDLPFILMVSCNSAFAEMGTETLGPDVMVPGAESWGFNQDVPIDLTAPAQSFFPTDFTDNLPKLAQASIGQNDVSATPLQMALVAAGVANDGVIMTPHVLEQVTDANGNVVKDYEPTPWLTPLDPARAADMQSSMSGVVNGNQGTAANIRIPGVDIAAKTGTAQLGDDRVHNWMIAYAGLPGQDPTIALSVVVLNNPETGDFTGGQVAGPIVKAMIEQAMAVLAPGGTTTTPPATVGPGGFVPPAGTGQGTGQGTGIRSPTGGVIGPGPDAGADDPVAVRPDDVTSTVPTTDAPPTSVAPPTTAAAPPDPGT